MDQDCFSSVTTFLRSLRKPQSRLLGDFARYGLVGTLYAKVFFLKSVQAFGYLSTLADTYKHGFKIKVATMATSTFINKSWKSLSTR